MIAVLAFVFTVHRLVFMTLNAWWAKALNEFIQDGVPKIKSVIVWHSFWLLCCGGGGLIFLLIFQFKF